MTKSLPASSYLRISKICTGGLSSVDIAIPHRKLSVVTGATSTGKTSLVINTIYAEARARIASGILPSGRSRSKMELLSRSKCQEVSGLLPAISLSDVKSEVPTDQPLCKFLGLDALFLKSLAHYGVSHCTNCGDKLVDARPLAVWKEITATDNADISSGGRAIYLIGAVFRNESFSAVARSLEANFVRTRGESEAWAKAVALVEKLRQIGYRRFFVDGALYKLPIKDLSAKDLDSFSEQQLDEEERRFYQALKLRTGEIRDFIAIVDSIELSLNQSELKGRVMDSLDKSFSLGVTLAVLIERSSRAVASGLGDGTPVSSLRYVSRGDMCIRCLRGYPSLSMELFQRSSPVCVCSSCNGRAGKKVKSVWATCETCFGTGLSEYALNSFLFGRTLGELCGLPLDDLFGALKVPTEIRGDEAIDELERLKSALQCLCELGLGNLTLFSRLEVISEGEFYKLLVAKFFFQKSVDTMFIVEQPSNMLHPSDLGLFRKYCRLLVGQGNTLVVVERDESFIRGADYLIELEWTKGAEGASVAFQGEVSCWPGLGGSSTEKLCFSRAKRLGRKCKLISVVPSDRRVCRGDKLEIKIPLNALVAMVGPAGSGKTVLMRDIICNNFKLFKQGKPMSADISGFENLQRCLYCDGRDRVDSSRQHNTVASFVGVADDIGEVFASLPAARQAGLKGSDFSLEKPSGRCEACKGLGYRVLDLDFLGYSCEFCEDCYGRRYQTRVLKVLLGLNSIDEVLRCSVANALVLFRSNAAILSKLRVLERLGLGGVVLGASLEMVSYSVFQRLVLSRLLSRTEGMSSTLYVMEQPFSGLDKNEVSIAMDEVSKLTTRGVSLLFSSHDPTAVSRADCVINLGAA